MNTISTLKKQLVKIYTSNNFSFEEANCEIEFAIEILYKITAKDIILGAKLTENELESLKNIINTRVSTKKPMAQILGYSIFMNEKFEVTEDTLIPRPETELLVKKSIEIVKQHTIEKILDIGTGSGCIACMLAKNTNAQVLGVDISNEALKIALNNAMHLDLMNKALFRKSDLFSKIRENEKFDLIVSNPPYIPPQEKENLQTEVKDFEPYNALFTTDAKGLEFYEKIINQANQYLNPNGFILFEIGINQGDDICKILNDNGYSLIERIKDVSNTERVIIAQLQ
jgi:release factor glutamine methyltransferase